MQQFDALVIGAGLSGLTAASLMAKRGLSVGVLDRNAHPGGSCGAFKRGDALFDQGAAMLFGFGAHGFNPHRFVFDALEEPIDVIRHESMYALDFAGKRIEFKPDLERFTDDLAGLFPGERAAIKRFYADLETLYRDVVVGTPTFTTPDEMDGKRMMPQIKAHPRSYLQFLGLMNRSVADLLGRYFEDPGIFQFFDKLCSTYCYTTAAETPAVLGAVMVVDNHVGGTYYPAGSTLMLPGKLEKAIEAHGGTMLMRREVEGILFEGGRPCGVRCVGGEEFHAATVVHAGTVWDLYRRLLPPGKASRREQRWVESLVPTAASAVVYLLVRAEVVPTDALPVEMFALHPDRLADDEVTAYAMSLDDPTLCPPGTHVLTVVGPCLDATDPLDPQGCLQMKRRLVRRFLGVLERRCPGIGQAVLHCEVATPATISRYAGKYRGAVAGPKQMMGQHLMKRQHTRTRWKGIYCCGESTVMGTGTPTVTISGIAAANAVLKECGKEPFAWRPDMPGYVREVPRGHDATLHLAGTDEQGTALANAARRCCFCEHPRCNRSAPDLDVPGIMRRVAVGNLAGARRLAQEGTDACGPGLSRLERACLRAQQGEAPAPIAFVVGHLLNRPEKPPLQAL